MYQQTGRVGAAPFITGCSCWISLLYGKQWYHSSAIVAPAASIRTVQRHRQQQQQRSHARLMMIYAITVTANEPSVTRRVICEIPDSELSSPSAAAVVGLYDRCGFVTHHSVRRSVSAATTTGCTSRDRREGLKGEAVASSRTHMRSGASGRTQLK